MSNSHSQLNELEELVFKLIDSQLSKPEIARLSELLKTPEAQTFYFEQMELHAAMERNFSLESKPLKTEKVLDRKVRPQESSTGIVMPSVYIAATSAVLICLTWFLASLFWFPDPLPPKSANVPSLPTPSSPKVELAKNWNIDPTDDADFEIRETNRIRLNRGELRIKKFMEISRFDKAEFPDTLVVETPSGESSIDGESFVAYYGPNHAGTSGSSFQDGLSRVLVVEGKAELINEAGSAQGTRNELLVTRGQLPPEKMTVTAGSELAFDMYKHIATKEAENIYFSPFSISMAMLIALEGAEGETAREILRFLKLPAEADFVSVGTERIPLQTMRIRTGFQTVVNTIHDFDENGEIIILNLLNEINKLKAELASLDKEITTESNPDTIEALKIMRYEKQETMTFFSRRYNLFRVLTNNWFVLSGPDVQFNSEYEESVPRIYSNVAPNTHARFGMNAGLKLIPMQTAETTATLQIINDFRISGKWRRKFDPSLTEETDFQLTDGTLQSVAMMHEKNELVRYGAFDWPGNKLDSLNDPMPGNTAFEILSLPFKEETASFVFIVPKNADDLHRVEEQLNSESFRKWNSVLEHRFVDYGIPNIRFGWGRRLTKLFERMGIDFNGSTGASFAPMCTHSAEKLILQEFTHAPIIEITEGGSSFIPPLPDVIPRTHELPKTPFPKLRLDRPFLFVVVEHKTDSILSIGRFTNPEKAKGTIR